MKNTVLVFTSKTFCSCSLSFIKSNSLGKLVRYLKISELLVLFNGSFKLDQVWSFNIFQSLINHNSGIIIQWSKVSPLTFSNRAHNLDTVNVWTGDFNAGGNLVTASDMNIQTMTCSQHTILTHSSRT